MGDNNGYSQSDADKLRNINNKNSVSNANVPSALKNITAGAGIAKGFQSQVNDSNKVDDPSAPSPSGSDLAKNAAKALLPGGNLPSNKDLENADPSVKLAVKTQKILKWGKFIIPILPYLLVALTIFIVIVIVFAQAFTILEKVDGYLAEGVTGIDKIINLAATGDFQTSEDQFFGRLSESVKDFSIYAENGEVLDIPLIASAVHYSKVNDPGVYGGEYEDISSGTYSGTDFSQFFGAFIETADTTAFYKVANDKLGNLFTIVPGKKGLLGHLANPDISFQTMTFSSAIEAWNNLFNYVGDTASSTVSDFPLIGKNPITSIGSVINYIATLVSYKEQHQDKLDWDTKNLIYDIENILEGLDEFSGDDMDKSERESTDGGGFGAIFPAPKVTVHNDYKHFRNYLTEIYVPLTYFSNEDYTEVQIKNIVDEIFEQKESYTYLLGDLELQGGGNSSATQSCGGNCSYDLSYTNRGIDGIRHMGDEYKNVSNIYVQLHRSSTGWDGAAIDWPLIPFEDYIEGVVYAEVDAVDNEVVAKAQATAARSYALVRPSVFNNKRFIYWEHQGDKWILHTRSSTDDQVYTSIKDGRTNMNNTAVPGKVAGRSQDTYKHELSDEQAKKYDNMIKWIDETAGQVLVDSKGYILVGEFKQREQTAFENMSKSKTYEEAILACYNGSGGCNPDYVIKQNKPASLKTVTCTGSSDPKCVGATDAATWKQNDPSWGSIKMCNSETGTIANVGCLVTSVSIQASRSGASKDIENFNPGIMVEKLKAVNGLPDCNLLADKVTEVLPKFKTGELVEFKNDTKEQKYQKIEKALKDNCYMVLEVKGATKNSQHWVAVTEAKGGNVYMIDPASDATVVWDKYESSRTSKFRCYKYSN